MEIFYNILTFIAGLGALLLSVKLLGTAMQALVGNNLKQKLHKVSSNRLSGLGVGTLSTVLLQSATAVTILVVSFIQAGMITFAQSFAIILGINIGAGIIISTLLFGSIKLGTIFASLTGIGAFIVSFSRREKTRQIGQAILAFGLLFLSLNIITSAMSYFNTLAGFEDFMAILNTPALLVLLGVLFCSLVQSSLASNAVILSLCGGLGVAGVLDIQSALWLAIGVKLSPSISVLMSSIGSSADAKKASLFYNLINVVTGIIFILLYFTGWTYWLESVIQDPAVILVVFNILMAIVGSLIFLPFSNFCGKIMSKIIKGKSKSNIFEMDNATLLMPGSAIITYGMQAETIIDECIKLIRNVYDYIFRSSRIKQAQTLDKKLITLEENCVQMANHILTSLGDMSEADKKRLIHYHVIADRVKSLTHRTIKMLEVAERSKPKENFSQDQLEKINELYDIAMQIASIARQTITKLNNDESIDEELVVRIFELDERLVKEKMDIRKSISSDKKYARADAYARIVNELEQMGEQFASISLAYFDNIDEEKINEI